MKNQETPDQVLESLYDSYQEAGLHAAETTLWRMLHQSTKQDEKGYPGCNYEDQETMAGLVINVTSLLSYVRERYTGKEYKGKIDEQK